MPLGAALRIPAPDEKVDRWHVSPLIDLSAYSLGWLWVLVPLLLLGPTRADYIVLYLLVIAATDLHRHFGLPYVYFDRQVRERYPARFWLFPALMLLAFAASPWLAHAHWQLDAAQLCAGTSWLIVLLQVLRRDGGPRAVPGRELVLVLGGSLTLALALELLGRAWPSIETAWWWSAAALFAATYFDWTRAKTRPRTEAPADSSDSPAIAFFSSLAIVASMGVAIASRWIDALALSIPIETLLEIVGVFAALWNFWHVYMQKYGIMRMYNAKALAAAGPGAREVPGWTDKLLLLCWLPLYFAWLGPLYREIAVDYFDDAAAVLPGFIDLLEQAMPVTMPITIGLVVVAHVLWLRAQWSAYGKPGVRATAPRLWMAGGTSALALCFFAFDPVKVYMAFAFSHAIEYCVFVWAFQRRRYQAPLEHQPLLGRLLRHPLVFYVGLILLFGVGIMLLKFWGKWIFVDSARPKVLGYRTAYWLGFWGVYQSMVHFYFDGFLWKMRLASVRANL